MNKGIAVVFNTHYPSHALKISDKSLIMKKDGLCLFGETKKVINCINMRDSFSVNVHIEELEICDVKHYLVVPLSIV
jgi:iron complex transport system ATP-binding protein